MARKPAEVRNGVVGVDMKPIPDYRSHREITYRTGFYITAAMAIVSFAAAMYLLVNFKNTDDTLSEVKDKLETALTDKRADEGMLQLIFEGQFSREFIEMTDVTVSAYSSRREETDDTPWENASGGNVMVGQIAVSRDLINDGLQFGSIVYLEGLGVFRVADVMAPRWKQKVDIWCADKTACQLFGIRNRVTMVWMDRTDP